LRLLLDTPTLLWLLEADPRLSRRAAGTLADADADKLVSAVTAFEICL
jgi:PIN domain nuclease of toxin-antitoxin system